MELRQLSEHVYYSTPDPEFDRPLLGVVVGRDATLVIDSGNSPAHARWLLDALEARGIPAPTCVALTHWHWDHIFGTSVLDVPTYAHSTTRDKVAEMASFDWRDEALEQRVREGREIPFCSDYIVTEMSNEQRANLSIRVPERLYDEQVRLDLGGVTCELVHVGGDHAADSSVIYVPEDRVLFLGDCLGSALYDGPRHYTADKLFPLAGRLLEFDAEYYLEGHGSEPLSRVELEGYAALARTVWDTLVATAFRRDEVIAAMERQQGRSLDEDEEYLMEMLHAGNGR